MFVGQSFNRTMALRLVLPVGFFELKAARVWFVYVYVVLLSASEAMYDFPLTTEGYQDRLRKTKFDLP